MKRLFYVIACFAITGSAILVACDKQKAHRNTIKPATAIEKNGSLTDAQLIDIINGLDPDYTKIEEVEEVLFDNCKLSSPVLRALIAESKYPNYIVEEMMILSAPVASSDLAYLHTARPSLSTTAIASAATLDWAHSEYVILNSSPRQILVGKGLTRKSLCANGCGESEYRGTDLVMLDLTSTTTPLDPAEMIDCDGVKWYCGKAVESRVALSDGTSTIVVLKCEGSEGKCASKATATK